MKKRDEIADPNSCFNKARDDEIVFVLLARDEATADTIRYWANKRVKLGKNRFTDEQIVKARKTADVIEAGHTEDD